MVKIRVSMPRRSMSEPLSEIKGIDQMNIQRERKRKAAFRGFSLVETMIVLAMLTLIVGRAIFTQVEQVQQRSVAEQGRVDDFQQARDFVDQIFRDTRQMGYPNVHNFDTSTATPAAPSLHCGDRCLARGRSLINDCRLATGLVKLTSTELDFEGDVDGSGTVSIVSYKVNGSGTCATCIQRAQVPKANGTNPLTQVTNVAATSYNVEVENVQNTAAGIFTAYDVTGTAIALPIDITSNAANVAQVRVIQAQLKIASATAIDPKTRQQLEADIEGRVQVVNCSMATTGLAQANGVQITCQ